MKRTFAWLFSLALLVGLLPSGVAFAADSEASMAIVYEQPNGEREDVGTATLSLTGGTLTYTAHIAKAGYEMTRFQLAMGAHRADVALTGSQRTNHSGAFTGVDAIKNYALTIDLVKNGTTTESKTFRSDESSWPGAKQVALTRSVESWTQLSWTDANPSPTGMTPNAYLAQAGAQWLWNRPDSNTQGGTERALFEGGAFELPGDITVTSAVLAITADNAYSIEVNGTLFTQPTSKFFTTATSGAARGEPVNTGTVYDWSWSFQNVDVHDIKGALHGGRNPFTIRAFNAQPLTDAYNPAGVIYRLDVGYTRNTAVASVPFARTGTLPQPASSKCSLAIAMKLIRINGAPVAPTAPAKPGDALTYELTMTNTGDVAVRTGPIAVRVPSGLTASGADNPAPWAVSANAMTYAHPNSIPKGGVDRAEFVLRVPSGANGAYTIDASAPTLIRPDGSSADNPTPSASAIATIGGDGAIYGLRIAHELKLVNGQPAPSNYVARPGDRLTFTMSMRNTGNRPVRPGTVNVRYTSGLYAQDGDNANPPWTQGAGMLVYAHDGSMIPVGETRRVDYVLRVRGDCPSGNQTIDTDVPTVIDGNGEGRDNIDPKGTLPVPVGPGSSAADHALQITHRLIRINDAAVGGAYTIKPGDRLTYTMTMANIGNQPVRPGTIAVTLTRGLYAQQSDNANPPWTVNDRTLLTYTHDGTMIPVGARREVDYVVRVASDCGAGNQTITTNASFLIDGNDRVVANRTATDSFPVPVSGGGSAAYDVTTRFWLAYVNGRATGWTHDSMMPATIQVRAGDALTYMLRTTNNGSLAVYPTEYVVALPSNQSFDPAENPGWVQRDGDLVYAYGGGYIQGNSYHEVPLKLRVKRTGGSTITISVIVSQIKGMDGSSTSGGCTTLNIPVSGSGYENMAETGEGPLALLPMLCGALTLAGGGCLFATRRRRKTAKG